MKLRHSGYILFLFVLGSFILNYEVIYSQDQQTSRDQTAVSKNEIPITTSSQDARQKYIEGRDQIENVQVDKARPLFEEAIKADPNFALGYLGLFLSGGNFTANKQNIEKAVSLMDKASEGEKLLITFYKDQFDGNIAKQKKDLEQLQSMFPDNKRVELIAGTFEQFVNQDYDAAIRHYQKAIKTDPNYAPAYNIMGYAYSDKNDFSKAEEAFKKYISLNPNSPNPYDSYAELLLRNGRYDASIEQYNKALDIDPVFVSSIEGLGNNYLFKGDFAKAHEFYQSLYDKAPTPLGKFNALYDQAAAYVREGNINDALSSLDKRASLAESEGSIPTVINSHELQGLILAENGKPDDAMKHFDMASEKIESSSLSDQQKENLMNQAKLDKLYGMVAAGKLDAANNELQSKDQVVGSSGNPQNEKRYESVMGLLAFKQNKYDEAIQHFSKADNANPINWYYTAVAYQKKGDNQKAAQLMDKIKQSNQNSVELAIANNHAKETLSQNK